MSCTFYKGIPQLKFLLLSLLCVSIPMLSQKISTKNEVITQITINATPEEVWSMLIDVDKYPDWHPYIKKIEWRLERNAPIKVTYKKNDTQDAVFSAYIIDMEPNRMLSWGGSLGFIFRAKHYYRIESVNNDSVKLTQGEYWRGIFGGMYGKKIYVDTTNKFQLMNKKIKQVLESKF
jgi:hypothetical protein